MKKYFTEEKIIEELDKLVTQLGKFPVCREIRDLNCSLLSAIHKTHDINYYREKLGYKNIYETKGYWTETRIISELEKVIKENLGIFPTKKEFKNQKGLLRAINKNGGINYFRNKLNFELQKKPNGFWKNWDNLEKEVKIVYDMLGRFPTKIDLINLGRQDLQGGIDQYGGMDKIKTKMEIEDKYQTKDGHYVNSSYEFIFDEFLYSRGIQHDVGLLIDPASDRKFKYDFKIDDNYFEIWGYGENENEISKFYMHRKKEKIDFYTERNLKLIHIEYDFFICKNQELEIKLEKLFENLGFDFKNIRPFSVFEIKNDFHRHTIKSVIEDIKNLKAILGCFPKQKDFTNEWSYLKSATHRHGGLNYFKEIIENPGKDPFEQLKIKEEIKNNKIKDIVKLYNEHISMSVIMEKTNYTQAQIYHYLKKEKVKKFRNDLRKYSDEDITNEIKSIILDFKLDHFPTHDEFKKFSNLSSIIIRHGGTNKFRKILGYEPLIAHGGRKMIQNDF